MIKNQKDAALGGGYVLTGTAFAMTSTHYPMGNLSQMGAGYFPLVLGSLLIALGAIVAVRAMTAKAVRERLSGFKPGIAMLIFASVLIFPLLLDAIGLLGVCFTMFMVASCAAPGFAKRSTLLAAALVTLVSALLFVLVLKLNIPLLPAK